MSKLYNFFTSKTKKAINIADIGFGEVTASEICSPLYGKVITLKEVQDPVFSDEILGKGMAVIPSKGKV